MTQKTQTRRLNALKTAAAINAIEGVPVSDYAKALYASWAHGELTGEQMKAALAIRHRQLAAQEGGTRA